MTELPKVGRRDFPRCKVCKHTLDLSGTWLTAGFEGVVNLRPPKWLCPNGHEVLTIALPPLSDRAQA